MKSRSVMLYKQNKTFKIIAKRTGVREITLNNVMIEFSQKEKNKCSTSPFARLSNNEVSQAKWHFPWNSLRYSGHNWLQHLGKFREETWLLEKRKKLSQCPRSSLSNSRFAVGI